MFFFWGGLQNEFRFTYFEMSSLRLSGSWKSVRTCNQDSYIPRRGESSSRRREEAKAELLKVLPREDWHKSRETRRTKWYDPREWAGHWCFREEEKGRRTHRI